MILEGGRGGVCIEKSIPRGRGGEGSVLKNQFEEGGGGGGSELSDQLLDPDVPTLASQDKLKVSPKGLPFVITCVQPRLMQIRTAKLRVLLITGYDATQAGYHQVDETMWAALWVDIRTLAHINDVCRPMLADIEVEGTNSFP